MAVSTFPSPATASVPNWQLLQTATPSAVAAVTFSGLSGYAKYRIVTTNLTVVTCVANPTFTLNGDSGTNYSRVGVGGSSPAAATGTVLSNGLSIGSGLTTTVNMMVVTEIENALLLAPKVLTLNYYYSNNGPGALIGGVGVYQTTSLLTSITFTLSASTFNGGSIYLLGVN